MAKRKETARVQQQTCIAPGIFDMWIETSLAQDAKPGQFINIYPDDKSTLLPRPISICEADKIQNRLRVVYRTEKEHMNFPDIMQEKISPYSGLWEMDFL